MRSHHDVGGLPGGPIDRTEHALEDWERRADAMGVLIGAKRLVTVDERRLASERLDPALYDRLGYYERWLLSLGTTLIQRGLLTTDDMKRKMVEIEKRGG